MTPSERSWILSIANQALEAKHIYPNMAACEAALESGFGTSELARDDLNLFGMKQHQHPVYGTVTLPTKEFLRGEWQVVDFAFVKYDTIAECFADRMATLVRLRDMYPHYQAALTAPDPQTYIAEVSKTWSTDPQRAGKVLAIYQELWPTLNNSEAVQDAATGANG